MKIVSYMYFMSIFVLSVTIMLQEMRNNVFCFLDPNLRVQFIIGHGSSLWLLIYDCVCSFSHLGSSGFRDSKRRGMMTAFIAFLPHVYDSQHWRIWSLNQPFSVTKRGFQQRELETNPAPQIPQLHLALFFFCKMP